MTEQQRDLISIIVATRGTRDLAATLQSVAKQAYSHREVITVVDKDSRGAPWARNQGAMLARGEFLLFLDDDIVLRSGFLSAMHQALIDHPESAYAYCSYERGTPFRDISWAHPFDARRLRRSNYISTMSLMRRDAFVPWDERLRRFQDWDMWLNLLERGRTGVLVDGVLFAAEYQDDCITGTDAREISRMARTVRLKHGMIVDAAKDIIRQAFRTLLRKTPDMTP